MNNFIEKLDNSLSGIMNKENSFFSEAKESLRNKSISLPLTAEILEKAIKSKFNEKTNISDLSITIEEDFINISGIAKKMFLKVKFEVSLELINASGRTINFKIIKLKPLNQEWINSKVFNYPPLLVYGNDVARLDLNELEQVRAIPVGHIKTIEIKNRKLLVEIGL